MDAMRVSDPRCKTRMGNSEKGPDPLAVGNRVLDRYLITERMESGGTSVVYRATDERLTFAVTTVEIPKEILDLGPFISISPSFCIVDDRLLVSLKSTDLKRELKRLFGGRDDEAPHALVSRVLAEPEAVQPLSNIVRHPHRLPPTVRL